MCDIIPVEVGTYAGTEASVQLGTLDLFCRTLTKCKGRAHLIQML